MSSKTRAEAKARLVRWFEDTMYHGYLVGTGLEPAPTRVLVGESDWHPIMETSMGPVIGRAKYELFDETSTWHVKDGKIIRHEPVTVRVEGSKRIKEEYYGG